MPIASSAGPSARSRIPRKRPLRTEDRLSRAYALFVGLKSSVSARGSTTSNVSNYDCALRLLCQNQGVSAVLKV